jgi:V-type H+-transporting ATPase subunit C
MCCVQAFSAWIHICAIRLFTESILRYGLPPKFLGCLLKPNPKQTTKLRKLLGSMFGTNGAPPLKR